jgi:hypothetical protein
VERLNTVTDVEEYDPTLSIGGMSYEDLTAGDMEMYSLGGVSLVNKQVLLGVPFVITQVTYQLVPPKPSKGERVRGYVSCEATVGDERALTRAIKRGHVPNVSSLDQLNVDPDERIVFNDGGTGVRRQLTALLHTYGIVRVFDGEVTGHNRVRFSDGTESTYAEFDVPWDEWKYYGDQTRMVKDKYHNDVDIEIPCVSRSHKGGAFLLSILHGLHVSDYTNEYGEGETYYLK